MMQRSSNLDDVLVWVVDDDEAVCDSMQLLLKTVGLASKCFANAESFIEQYDPEIPGCIVVDLRMPGMSGLELQEMLRKRNSRSPIIFITAHGTVDSAVHAMRSGAVDFLQKPCDDQKLLDCIQRAVRLDLKNRGDLEQVSALRERVKRLTNREREVMACVVKGQANKVIAMELDVSERTVEIHRSRVMKKMEAGNLAELVKMGLTLEKYT